MAKLMPNLTQVDVVVKFEIEVELNNIRIEKKELFSFCQTPG